jgi:hypothetical protein
MLSILRDFGCRGSGPSPRTRHVATMYDDRYLLVFGGASKSKPLSDLFALDFETVWHSDPYNINVFVVNLSMLVFS